jgi:D-alanyl-lipoteichoic acid acyltransferase DltB (MBOAT superfamily)
MLFNTARYVLFLPATVLFYYLLPFKFRYIWLLAASYYFYMQWNPWYSLLLFTCTLTTWTAGMLLSGLHTQEQAGRLAPETGLKLRRLFLTLCILFNLGILAFFKYVPFGLQCLNRLFALLRLPALACDFHITLPVGISFFILQSLGYLIDIYRNDIQAEKNVLRYALFVSFFPQLVAGPIERSQNLLTQLQTPHRLRFSNLKKGGLLILYGLFLKMVIADRAAVLVNTVLGDTASWPGFYIVIALLFFSVQIYCDFHGYSTIARGSALMMGIHLLDNFNAPYFSRSVKEFWQRWHLSLSGWFRDYLYIPLGGNRKGPIRKESNLLTVFAVSGLWHGASLGFIFWGIFNALCQIAADLREEVAKRRLVLWNRILPIQDGRYFRDAGHLNNAGASLFTPFFYETVTSGALETKHCFYESYEEKLRETPPALYGLYYREQENLRSYYIASNRQNGMEYRIIITPQDGEQYCLQDFDTNAQFRLPKDLRGVCTLVARMADTPEQVVHTMEIQF